MQHQFTLQAYTGPASRFTCPACGKPKCFKRYINTQTRQPVSETTGKCDRQLKCGYHQTPRQYFESRGMANHLSAFVATPCAAAVQPPSYINAAVLKASRSNSPANCFVKFLGTVLPAPVVSGLIETYQIADSNHWPGATVFWQIDYTGHIRTGKIMLYNATTGRRVKQPFNHVAWAHKALNLPGFNLKQCLFGEHLLHKYPYMPVALVESEKSALIASAYFPQLLWLATGSLQGLTQERCKVLAGRKVTLYPDVKGYDSWKQKAEQISYLGNATLSNLLENAATPQQKTDGWDMADYLLLRNLPQFLASQAVTLSSLNQAPVMAPAAPAARQQRFWQPPVAALPQVPAPPVGYTAHHSQTPLQQHHTGAYIPPQQGCIPAYTQLRNSAEPDWDIETLENFFASCALPTGLIAFSPGTITHPAGFVSSHLAIVKHQANKRAYKPYYERLVKLMKMVGGEG